MIVQVLPPGSNLQGKYRVERLLGQGGFGITYLAVHEGLGKKVAIKELFLNLQGVFCSREEADRRTVRPHFVHFDTFKTRFLNEARTLARFTGSRGIVQINDMFEENNTVYFVMDFIEGDSLSQLVQQRGTLPEKEAVSYALQVLQALSTVHREGILHRDLKPDNLILRQSDGQMVLIDFGISREYVEDETQTQTAMLSVGYAPPEQKLPKARRTASMDIYGVGAVLYFCLTGQRPQTTDEVAMDRYLSPWDLNPAISPYLNEVINKAIAKKPADRYQSAEEMMTALQYKPSEMTEVWDVGEKEATLVFERKHRQQPLRSGNFIETVNGIPFTMVYVEGGTFQMGDVMGDNEYNSERPIHEVRLDGYFIGETTVTQALWRAVMGDNPSYFSDCDNCPVEHISWEDISNKFLTKLHYLSGREYRLPTEAEWEYAARERGRSVRFGNGKNLADPKEINFDGGAEYKKPYSVVGQYREKNTPVKTFAPNALGLYDMSGNVWEWCHDWYGYYSVGPKVNPKGPDSGKFRIYRGGGWCNNPQAVRVFDRSRHVPKNRSSHIGFRLALSVESLLK